MVICHRTRLIYLAIASRVYPALYTYVALHPESSLARLVQAISAAAVEEKEHERLYPDCTSEQPRAEQPGAGLGAVPGGEPGRADPGAGSAAAGRPRLGYWVMGTTSV
jgi:hypothetical protein